ncbi:hypothetical protein BBJ28_00006630, partial [Nothophytophthora sp. Chile5]
AQSLKMQELQCVAQSYAWGKPGLESSVAQLKVTSDRQSSLSVCPCLMGTHPNGPSRVIREDGEAPQLLSDWIRTHAGSGGDASGDLPFLFKVLSVQKALSIQAHPDLKLARELHEKFPQIYKDPNHKPEMTIALTRFEALYVCQFRHMSEIATFLQEVPELSALVDAEGEEGSRCLLTLQVVERFAEGAQRFCDEASLREFFRCFVYTDADKVAAQIGVLRARLEAATELSALEKLVLRLDDAYPGDIGCFCPFLLNYLTLEPGEAMFLSANEPHAYLSGDCIECMACSDNVVRAGLTPKFIDKETLHSMLTYRTGKPRVYKGEIQGGGISRLYSSPVPEFEVEAIELKPRQRYALPARAGASIVLVISGSGSTVEPSGAADGWQMSKGRVYFLPKGEVLEIQGGDEGLVAFRASPNESVAPPRA